MLLTEVKKYKDMNEKGEKLHMWWQEKKVCIASMNKKNDLVTPHGVYSRGRVGNQMGNNGRATKIVKKCLCIKSS